ncbi:hypothetical protein [Rickettsia endosymbiont of Orchestes rusci]|uniref:hypothetical protein n=1 Tax=Rickettsia endosymbiont of Orchestes rusci TaxID=3066250 RepID=UPI00313CC8DC
MAHNLPHYSYYKYGVMPRHDTECFAKIRAMQQRLWSLAMTIPVSMQQGLQLLAMIFQATILLLSYNIPYRFQFSDGC